MPDYSRPIRGTAWKTRIVLYSFGTPGALQSNPTIAAGDFKISKDGGALANLTTLPAVEPASSVIVELDVSATEMTADEVAIVWIDQTANKEWSDGALVLLPAAS